jgi:hypothetical protein
MKGRDIHGGLSPRTGHLASILRCQSWMGIIGTESKDLLRVDEKPRDSCTKRLNPGFRTATTVADAVSTKILRPSTFGISRTCAARIHS